MMPKGWMKAPVSDGWVQIIRGPRPKSERWSHASRTSRSATHHPSRRDVPSGDPILQPRQPSRPPEKVVMEANVGGVQVGGRCRRTWRREKCSRKTSARRSEDGQSPVQSVPCAREDGIMSEVHRTGQEMRDEGRGSHHKGHRAKGSVPPSQGGRRTFKAARVRSSSASIFGASGGRFAASDRCTDFGARLDAENDAGRMVQRRPSQTRSNPSRPCPLRIFKISKCGSAIGIAS